MTTRVDELWPWLTLSSEICECQTAPHFQYALLRFSESGDIPRVHISLFKLLLKECLDKIPGNVKCDVTFAKLARPINIKIFALTVDNPSCAKHRFLDLCSGISL